MPTDQVKSLKAEAKIRKELRNLRPHRQFNFKDMIDFNPAELKIDSSTSRHTRGADSRKKKQHKPLPSKPKKAKTKPQIPVFEMPSQIEMLKECAYQELLNTQQVQTNNDEFTTFGNKKYLGKRKRESRDWSKLEDGKASLQ